MRDLEDKIANWRKQMAAGGVKIPAVLDELESHLREDVERQLRSGFDAEKAFELAAQRMGKSDLLKAEFAKIGGSEVGHVGKVIGIACCVFAALYSMLLAPHLFTIHELSLAQRALGLSAVALTFLSLVSWRFSYKYLPIIQSRRTRTLAVMSCAVAALAWMLIFANLLPTVIVPYALGGGVTADRFNDSILNGSQVTLEGFNAVYAIGISLLWAMTLAAVLGAVAYGLEAAARHDTKESAYV